REALVHLRRLLKNEHRLKERASACVAIRSEPFDQKSERVVLVRQGIDHRPANSLQQFVECRAAKEPRSDDYWIDEISNETGRLSAAPPRGRCTHEKIFLPGVPVQEDIERSKQNRKQSCVVP